VRRLGVDSGVPPAAGVFTATYSALGEAANSAPLFVDVQPGMVNSGADVAGLA